MSLNEPTVGTTAGPTWATETNTNWTSIDAHDHTSGKGVQLTPSSLNINGDLEFNQNSASELKNVIFDSSVSAASTNYSVYQASGNLYWRNNSGTAVQITDGSAVKTTGGSISGMSSTAVVLFSSNSYAFKFDVSASAGMNYDGIAKMSFSDIDLYKYDAAGSLAKVTLKFLGTGTTAALTVPDETGTLLSTATSFAGAINIATSSTNYPINLKPNGTGHVVIGNTGATGKLTSNGAYDLVLDTNSGTNSSSITITDAANGNISFTPNGTGEIVIGSGSASGKITSSGAFDLVLDTNAGTNSGTITITDGVDGNIDITPNGSGEVNISKVDIDGGTLDGTDVTVGSGKTLDVSAGTLTTSTAQKQAIAYTAFASGTKMIFNQTSAPTGWTKVTGSGDDTALRVTTGTVGTGGSVAFETAFASQSVGTTSITIAQLPTGTIGSFEPGAGKEYINTASSGYIATDGNDAWGAAGVGTQGIESAGSGSAHGHGAIDLDVSFGLPEDFHALQWDEDGSVGQIEYTDGLKPNLIISSKSQIESALGVSLTTLIERRDARIAEIVVEEEEEAAAQTIKNAQQR